MNLSTDNFMSWEVAAWFAVGVVVGVAAWRLLKRVHVIWQRMFFRAGIIALCFAPLPHFLMFTEEGAKSGAWMITPLWYALFQSLKEGTALGICFVLLLWLIITYFLWVLGMSLRLVFRNNHAT